MRFLSDDTVIDTGAGKRTMEVICAGLPRCATSSLEAALETPTLGYQPCMHMAHIMPWPERRQQAIDAMREPDKARRLKLVAKLFDGCAATSDFPGFLFVDDLMDLYPDAAVVLNQRDSGEAWAASIKGALEWFSSWSYLALGCLWQMHRQHSQFHYFAHGISVRKFGRPWAMDAGFYYAYNDWVRAEAKKRGRPVLEWQAVDGWEPLCKFLGKTPPPPGTKFPHVNDQATIRKLKLVIITQGVVSWVALGAFVWAGWTYGPALVPQAIHAVQGFVSR